MNQSRGSTVSLPLFQGRLRDGPCLPGVHYACLWTKDRAPEGGDEPFGLV
jgi:hypothetical protein